MFSHDLNGGLVAAAADKVAFSDAFRSAGRLQSFFRYIVSETLAGRPDGLKEYTIAVAAYGREEHFDPRYDSIIRVDAAELRSRLSRYYEREGRTDEVRISLPKGGYVPSFARNQAEPDFDSRPAELRPADTSLIARGTLPDAAAPAAAELALKDVLNSVVFRRAPKLRRLLTFLTDSAFAGAEEKLHQRSIAQAVFDTGPSFDPGIDSLVRVQAANLRSRLKDYYETEGLFDEVVIELPVGSYVPRFFHRITSERGGYLDADKITDLCSTGSVYLARRTPEAVALGRRLFVEAANLDARHPDPAIGLAQSWRAALDSEAVCWPEAISNLEDLVPRLQSRFPHNSGVHVCGSVLAAVTGRGDPMAQAELALRLNAKDAAAHFWCAALLVAAGRLRESLVRLKQAIRLEPFSLLYRVYEGRLLYYAGEYEGAIRVLGEVLSIDAAFPPTHLWLAYSLCAAGRYEPALLHARQSVALSECSATLSCLSYVLAESGHTQDSEETLQLLKAEPARYVCPLGLAAIHRALGNQGEAQRYFAAAEREGAWGLLWKNVDARVKNL